MLSLLEENEISGKSAENGRTSQLYKITRYGPTRPVYDSFWPQGPPKDQKIGLGGFRNLSDLQRAIHQFLRFFGEISVITRNFKNRVPQLSSSNFFSKIIFMQKHLNPWKLNTLAPFWYIYFGLTPITSKVFDFWNPKTHISQTIGNTLLWNPLIY